eukprot:762804-Hanusia_phi.AAC.7
MRPSTVTHCRVTVRGCPPGTSRFPSEVHPRPIYDRAESLTLHGPRPPVRRRVIPAGRRGMSRGRGPGPRVSRTPRPNA